MTRGRRGNGNGFGRMLAAARLRYGHMPQANAWMRITDDRGAWLVELVPGDQMVPIHDGRVARNAAHRIWWVLDGEPDNAKAERNILERSRAMREALPITKAVTLRIDDDGELVP